MNILLFLGCIILCELVGASGAIFTAKSVSTWYQKLKKPSINPPGWIFGPVWTLLFALMGISLYLVIDSGVSLFSGEIFIFVIQFIFNIIWSVLFFGIRRPGYSLIEILFLWFFILETIIVFYPISHLAAYLLVPYIFWVSFAAVLNFLIWKLNKR
jgi:tryptophan-rich sensory protein